MMTRLLFWLLLYPISLLPISVLYGIGHVFYWIIAYPLRYRKAVIDQNLANSFPEKTSTELKRIKYAYYRHLSELAVEMIKMLTISRKNVMKRYHCPHPEKVNCFYEEGRSVILMSSHYNNWEWMVLSLNMQFKHAGVGIGAPNSNKVFEKLINKARTRYGTEVIFANTIRSEFEKRTEKNNFTAYMMLSDQSPPNPEKSYKTIFLHQPSAMLFGAEHFAKKYDMPVLYYAVNKVKKGHYTIDIELISEEPQKTRHGEITEQYIQLLEKNIRSTPEYWLWSHKRWKHKIKESDIETEKE